MFSERAETMSDCDQVLVSTIAVGDTVIDLRIKRTVTDVRLTGRRVVITLDDGLVTIDAQNEDKIWKAR